VRIASLRRGGRDGLLALVSADSTRYAPAPGGIATFQSALDNWHEASRILAGEHDRLRLDPSFGEPVDPVEFHSPLPRAYQWCEGSTYVSHMERIRAARGMPLPPAHEFEPVVYQAGGDALHAPLDPLVLPDPAWGLDMEATIAVITDDVPRGTTADDAPQHILFVVLTNDVTYRNLLPREYAKGLGPYQSKPARAFAPFAVSTVGLGASWNGRLLRATVSTWLNDDLLGAVEADTDSAFDFAQMIAFLTETRSLAAGTIVGTGTVSNRDPAKGFGCLGEKRALEILESGTASTAWLTYGDRVRISATDAEGNDLFGAIEQTVIGP
jgi:fumarylacetoacetate (FAA) hydrolase